MRLFNGQTHLLQPHILRQDMNEQAIQPKPMSFSKVLYRDAHRLRLVTRSYTFKANDLKTRHIHVLLNGGGNGRRKILLSLKIKDPASSSIQSQ